jgi:hypothetical protein
MILFGKGMIAMTSSTSMIENYEAITKWANSLVELEDSTWFKPIAEGKASIAEIVSHLMNWDRHLITGVIPSVLRGEGMVFPDFDPFNARAFEYAKSGVTKNQLLGEFCATRMELCKLLMEIGEDSLRRHVTANGEEQCPHTGTPYSLLVAIQEFTDHDNHHINQINNAIT